MTYFPQEAKEQIAELMSNVEKLENQKKELLGQVADRNRKYEQDKTLKMVLIALIVILFAFLIYTYLFGPIFGKYKPNVANTELLKSNIEKLKDENSTYKTKISELNLLLEKQAKTTTDLNSDLIYRVQVGAFKKFKLGLYSDDMKSVLEKQDEGFNKYSIGVFDNYSDALKFKKEIKRIGIRSAFLIAEYKGSRIDIVKAKELEKNISE